MKIEKVGVYKFVRDAHIYIDNMAMSNIRAKKNQTFKVTDIKDGILYCMEQFNCNIFKFPAFIDLPVEEIT